MAPKTRDAALYLRISMDRRGDGMAVDRQRDLATKLAKERGWNLVGEYVDNSISASRINVVRPAYNQLVADYEAGKLGAIIAYDLDRLTRQPRQLEDWIDAAEHRGLAIVTLNGEADLTTDGGRLFARVRVAVAKAETERKSQRQKDANAQRRERGEFRQTSRLFGYTVAGQIIPEEAAVVRNVYERFVAGESIRSIQLDLAARGIQSVRGSVISRPGMNRMLTNARYAGRMTFDRQQTGHLGTWEAILPGALFDTAQGIMTDPRRLSKREGTDRKHVGSGLYFCECGRRVRMTGGKKGRDWYGYTCANVCYTRSGRDIDEYVEATVAAWLDQNKVTPHQDEAANEEATDLARLRERLAQVERDYDDDLIDAQRYNIKRAKIMAELDAAGRAQQRSRASAALASLDSSKTPSDAFLAAPLGIRAQIVNEHFTVTLRRQGKGQGSRGFRPESVQVERKRAA
ncbi:recombinase family protein [Microbacterium rhizosphaerae]|uniref:Recombinase family protein n=1 Tax=Microbacterium rhizosphaerae TaxID=1678237 RepID=A0ABZ0SJT6_9MICO|nr:recombinase family protein [Microbacterium rhizosphaerae]WPR88384.1 recombinase family protein [Microbacterium rhizosphaerae]